MRAGQRIATGRGVVMTYELLKVTKLVKNFELRVNNGGRRKKRIVQAVTNVSFSLERGQTLGLVG